MTIWFGIFWYIFTKFDAKNVLAIPLHLWYSEYEENFGK